MSLDVLEDSDWLWGAGEWHLHARVDGNEVGDSDTEFEVRLGSGRNLPEADWSSIVDVSGKGPGSTVEIRLRVIENDLFGDDDLGEVRATLHYPYRYKRFSERINSESYYIIVPLRPDRVKETWSIISGFVPFRNRPSDLIGRIPVHWSRFSSCPGPKIAVCTFTFIQAKRGPKISGDFMMEEAIHKCYYLE